MPREALQVIGHLLDVMVAPEDPRAVLERIAHADTRIVSLSVTEKGYQHEPAGPPQGRIPKCEARRSPDDPATGALRLGDADIVHDLACPAAPRTALGFIVHALNLRKLRGLALLSCDNLPANGDILRGGVLAFAAHVDLALRDWIANTCSFPNSMVDRIVPRTTDADRERIASRLGLRDAWPVTGEPFLDWVIEDGFANGRPDWQAGGARIAARFVRHAEPFEKLKLRMVNGSHSALAHLGAVAGWRTVDRAVAEPALHHYLDTLLLNEIAPTLPALPGLELNDYRARLLQRFANPALQHQTQQIAMDGSQKLPQRLLGTVRDRLDAHTSIERLALAVAAWFYCLRGVDEAGTCHTIHDPLSSELAAQLSHAPAAGSVHDGVGHFIAFAPVFGDLGTSLRFISDVARHALSLQQRGVAATLAGLP